jgi:hypothetical protein
MFRSPAAPDRFETTPNPINSERAQTRAAPVGTGPEPFAHLVRRSLAPGDRPRRAAVGLGGVEKGAKRNRVRPWCDPAVR